MIEIKDLLIKFNKLVDNEELKISIIREVIKDVLKIEIPKEKISFKNGILKLDINPLFKNEIFIHKDLILSKIKEYGMQKDIRSLY